MGNLTNGPSEVERVKAPTHAPKSFKTLNPQRIVQVNELIELRVLAKYALVYSTQYGYNRRPAIYFKKEKAPRLACPPMSGYSKQLRNVSFV